MHHWLPPSMGEAGEVALGAEDDGEAATLLAWLTGAAGADGDAGAADGAADDGAADDTGAAAAGGEDTGTAAAGADDVGAAWIATGVELVYGQTKTSEVLVMVIVVSG